MKKKKKHNNFAGLGIIVKLNFKDSFGPTILPSNVNRKKGRIIIYMFKNWLKLVVLAILIEYLLGKNISQDSRSNWGVFNGPYIHYGKRKGNEQERRKM